MAKNLGFPPSNEKSAYFISYNSEDAGRISSTAMELYRLGLPLWYDNGLKYDEEWPKQIADHIQTAPALLMFISLALLKKKKSFVEREYDIATRDFGKPILIILLDDIKRQDVPNAKKLWWSEVDKLQHLLLEPKWSGQQCAALILEKLGIDPHTLTPPLDISSLKQPAGEETPGEETDTSADGASAEEPGVSGASTENSSEGRPRRFGTSRRTARTGFGRFIELISGAIYDEDDYYDDDDLNDDGDSSDDFYFDDEDEDLEDLPLTPGRIIDGMISSLRGMFARDKEADYMWIASFQRSPDAAAAPDGRLAVLIAVLLTVLGINLIYTTAYVSDPSLAYFNLLRHVIILGLGLMAAGLLVFIEPRHLKKIFFILYAVTAVSVAAKYYLSSASGTRSWYTMDFLRVGGLTFRLSFMLLLAFMLCLFAFINEDAAWIWPLILTFVTAVLEKIYLQATIQAFFAILIGLFVLSRYPVPLFRRFFLFMVIFMIAALILLPIINRFIPPEAEFFRLQLWTDPYSHINSLSPSYQYLLRVFSRASFIGDGIMGNTDLLVSAGPGAAPVFSLILDLYGWIGFAAAVLLFTFLSYHLFRCRKYAYECGYPELAILLDAVSLHFTLSWAVSALSSCLILPYMWEAYVPLMDFGSVQFIFLAELGLSAMTLRTIRKNSFAEVTP